MSLISSVNTKSNCCGGPNKNGQVSLPLTWKQIECDFWGTPVDFVDDLGYGPNGTIQIQLFMEGGSSRCQEAARKVIRSKIKNTLAFDNLFNPDGRLKNPDGSLFAELPYGSRPNDSNLLILQNLPEGNYCGYSFRIEFNPSTHTFQYECCQDGSISIDFNNFPTPSVVAVLSAEQNPDYNWQIFPPIEVPEQDPDPQAPFPALPPPQDIDNDGNPDPTPIPREVLMNPDLRKKLGVPWRSVK
jgi:hypothetical protein